MAGEVVVEVCSQSSKNHPGLLNPEYPNHNGPDAKQYFNIGL